MSPRPRRLSPRDRADRVVRGPGEGLDRGPGTRRCELDRRPGTTHSLGANGRREVPGDPRSEGLRVPAEFSPTPARDALGEWSACPPRVDPSRGPSNSPAAAVESVRIDSVRARPFVPA